MGTKIVWTQDQMGRYAVVSGWLRLSVSKRSRDGKYICLIDGCTLPIGSRKQDAFDKEPEACDHLLAQAESLLEETRDVLRAGRS